MTLKTGMLVGIVGSEDIGVLIQIRSASNSCVIKLNNGTLKKNVPLDDVEEAKDMSDTKEKKSPIRLGGAESPSKTPSKLASLAVDTQESNKLKNVLDIGDSVRARCNGGSRWFPGKIIQVHRDGTYDVEYSDGDIEKKMATDDVEAVSKLEKTPLGASSARKKRYSSSFAVGDKVKARYKKGSKFFSGKIARVRSDGTYDITYDDGDSETRVAKELIEPVSEVRKQDSEDEAPTRTKSSGFRVDQSIKAHYKGGKKLFSGKIKRVHSDGTYDVVYDDGDEEKRVKEENIEALGGPKENSEEDRKPAKGIKKLSVGKKVKARYKKGKRLFPGKISRVRSDGTYDIDYDDGEMETRVDASQIEVSDDEDMFADSDDDKKIPSTTKKKAAKWVVGDRVKVYYGKGNKLFPGKIAKVHMNGTYDIKYDDGDSEVRVEATFIQGGESDKSDQDKLLSSKSKDNSKAKSSTKSSLRVGDAVKAKYKRGARFFPGKITRERIDGTYDIKYEDGDVEERVKVDFIKRVDDTDEREDGDKPKMKSKKSFEVGDIVKAPFQKGNKLFRGKISRVRSDGTYDITFDDGDTDTHVPSDLIQPEEEQTIRDEKPKKVVLKVGDTVKARYKKGKKLFAGTVTRARSDGTFDIKYDDGDVEMRVEIEMIEVPESKKSKEDDKPGSQKSPKHLKVGAKVRARYNKGSKMFSGEITAVHRDGTYDVRYEDGDKEKHVEAKDIELEEDEREAQQPKSPDKLKVGDLVEAKYKNGVKMFPGKISRVHSDGTYDIAFHDGDSDRRVPRSRIKPQEEKQKSSPKKITSFAVGDAVKAKYKKGAKYFSGKIARVRSDGTYDIEYDDGDSETRVAASLIVSAEPEMAKPSADSPVPSKPKQFEVGHVIKARYKKGTKLFPGKITRVRSDGTYDIRYDDGDTEMSVEKSYIEGEEKPKARDKADEKKPEVLVVGDKVNAKYKGGMKMYPGKIVKVRMDGTFDVEYDDGDMELRVKSSSIELIPGSKVKKPEAKANTDKDDVFGDSDSDSKSKKRDDTKSGSIKVGDVVEANFKQQGKFHRGKVVRSRSDGTFDIEYDVGASEKHVHIQDIKKAGSSQDKSDDSGDEGKGSKKNVKSKPAAVSSGSDEEQSKTKPKKSATKKSKSRSSSESSESDREKQPPIKKGTRVTYRKADDKKARRVGVVRKVRSDGSCDVKYEDGDTSKRISRKLLVVCSDSENSDDDSAGKSKQRRSDQGPIYRRHEHVMCNWRRSSKLSKPKMMDKWTKAVVLERNSDGTYSIRYKDGVVEEDVPPEALKSMKGDSDSDGSSSGQRRKRRLKRDRTDGIGTESLFLLEQLAMTLFEEGALTKKPKLQLLKGGDDTSSSDSSASSSTESASASSKSSRKTNNVDKVLKRLFDSSSLQNYRRMFKENDTKSSGKISQSRIIALVEEFMAASKPTKGSGRANQKSTQSDDDGSSVKHILSEWFATHDDLRIHRRFELKTLMLAFAYAKSRLSKLRMEQSVATVLEGRFASYHESKRQLELWQQKLGYRLFETLQRHFHDHALPNMIPSRIRVSEVSLIFEQIAKQAMPNKPLEVYLQQHHLFPHHTLLLPEFLCCYYQLYGSEHSTSRWSGAVELRPVAFVASCLFSNGDIVCKRHGDLVRRLSVGRTQAQLDLILRFREAFESLLSTDTNNCNPNEEQLLETSQLSAFAAKVAPDPSLLEPAMSSLRKRSAAVSLVEVFGSCGFIIDELTSAPTIRNAIEKMRMRVDLAEVRRIIGLVRNICVKILRFPNNADYWRIRADSAAFQQKIGRFDGATSLLEAVGFAEYQKTHYELRGARNADGKRISALEKSTLDALREKCIQLDGELSLFDGVESISSILERISKVQQREGCHFTLEECQTALKHLSLYVENVLKNPKDSRCWCIREANSTFQRQIGYLPHATELMESIGFDLVESSNGNVYTLRGTGTSSGSRNKTHQETLPSASLSNFAFTSVSSQMEWFLWRRKQEIESLLEDEMKYLHEIVGNFSRAQNPPGLLSKNDTEIQRLETSESREAALVKMYPYGTNAIETFNKSSIQRRQLEMVKNTFSKMDVDQKGFLVEADFTRAYGSPSSLPAWSRFNAFDIGEDGKVDIADFVAALGPMLDHPYELTTNKNGEVVALSSNEDADPTLCEIVSLAVGNLRIGTSCSAAAVALESLLSQLYGIIQEPGNSSLWSIRSKMTIGNKLLRFPAGRELLRIVGFREATNSSNDNGSVVSTKTYELQQQRVRFKTSSSASELPSSLDTATLGRIQTIASMLAGHYRGLKNPCVSDVSAVSRAISRLDRCSENWSRVVQLGVKCLNNIEADPTNPRYRELNTATNTFTKIVGSVQGGYELLLSIGFRETDSGALRIPSDSSLEELRARHLELEVGLSLLRLRLANNEHLNSSAPSQVDQHARNQTVEKRSGHTTNHSSSRMNSQQETTRKVIQSAKGQPQSKMRESSNRVIRDRPATTAAQRLKHGKSFLKTNASQSARQITDPIEKKILSSFPSDEDTNSRVNRAKTLKNGKSTSNTLSRKSVTVRHNQALTNRKQAQRRSPSTPPSAGGHTMVLAKHADAGTETILVQKGQFVRRGAFVRVGAEIRDLYEERMVVEVSTNDHTPEVTMLRLGVPLRFFHAAKELVSTILVPTAELSIRLETSDNQTLVREVVRGIIDNVADQVMFQSLGGCELKREGSPNISKLRSTLVTSFEIMNKVPIVSSNIRVGPAMRYIATWSESSVTGEAPKAVKIFKDDLSEGKLQAYWEGLVLQSGTSNKSIRLGDLRRIVRRSAHLSMLLSTATTTMDQEKVFAAKSNDFQLAYDGFLAFFCLPPFAKRSRQMNREEEEDEARLQLPLAYFRKHFQILSQTTTSHTNGFKSVQALQLLRKVYKDIQDHPPVVYEDPLANQSGLEILQTTCLRLEKGFVGGQCTGCISWPEFVYFVRYNKFITIPEVFPATGLQLTLRTEEAPRSPCKEIAEVVSGMYSSRLVIIYFDGCVEVWNLAGGNPVQESMGFVLFSTKNLSTKSTSSGAGRGVDDGHQQVKNKTFMEAWMDANQTGDLASASYAKQAKLSSARIHQFKRSTGAFGGLVRLCAWDSIVCVNSSVLQESGSGCFRFFRLATNFVSPIRQVSVDHVKVDLSINLGKSASKVRSREPSKKGDTVSSSGVIRRFEGTTDGSKVVFLTASDTILWVACAGTGAILCHANLLASQVGRFRAFFQLIDNFLPSGESQAVLYATTSAKSYRHVGMWMLPQETNSSNTFERKKVFSFGKAKAATVTHIAVNAELLFVAFRDGSIIVWDTTTDQTLPILPLVCLQISLRDDDLHSIFCRPLHQYTNGFGTNMIQVRDNTAADIDQWETEVLQRFKAPLLRFALYLFDDAEVIRLPVSDRFDVRLVTLNDYGFEFEVFLAPVSGVEHNQARRVALHKHRITRVIFIALHHRRTGIFAQKSTQEFFQDFENHNIVWKTRDEMQKFALSYQENVVVELRPFYRRGDSEDTELTQPKCLNQTTPNGGAIEKAFPVFAIGATLKSRAGQTQLQTWKFAMNWLTDDARNELQNEPRNFDHAKRSLALQSSYQFEARRLLRIRNDYFREEHASLMKSRRSFLVQNVKDGLRDIIANIGQPNDAADNLLKAVNVLKLGSFNSHMGIDRFESFTNHVFYRAHDQEIVHQGSSEEGAKLSRLVELFRSDERNSVAFGAWIKRIQQEILAENVNREAFKAWVWVSILVRHLSVRTFTTAEVGALFVDLGLADVFTSSDRSHDTVEGFPSSASLPSFVSRLHRFLCSKADRNEKSKTLEATMDALLPLSAVVELIVECTNFSAFFGAKLTDLGSYLTKLSDADQLAPEEAYAIRLRFQEWKQKLRLLAQTQNELYCDFSDHESENVLEPTVEDLQQLQRFLRTPLPCVSPRLSSITLESRCDTIVCRDRFIMKAIGRLEGGGVEFVSLSVLYIFMDGEEMEQNFQQERTFLHKVQHVRVREYFLPALIETMNVPILPAANASVTYAEDRDGIHCIVTESLDGWMSLSECVKLMRLSPFDEVHWKPLLWFWSLRVLMALLTMQNERFTVKQGIDLSMLLVSPDGCDLQMCSLSGGEFVRYGEDNEDADSLSRSLAKVFGVFVYELLLRTFSDVEDIDSSLENLRATADNSEEVLCNTRNQVIRLLTSINNSDKNYDSPSSHEAALTDFSSASQIAALGNEFQKGGEVERLCHLALLALQPPSNRLGLQTLWVYTGKPRMDVTSQSDLQLKTLSMQMMNFVGLQRFLSTFQRDLRTCVEECEEGVCGENSLRRVVEKWLILLGNLVQDETSTGKPDKAKDSINSHVLQQLLEYHVPHQLCTIVMRGFTLSLKSGGREQGRQTVEMLLENFSHVLELVEGKTSFEKMTTDPFLMKIVLQVLSCLLSIATAQMPQNQTVDQWWTGTTNVLRFHRDTTSNAVLWRLSEPFFRELLAIEMNSSKYPTLLRWLNSRRPPFGFTPILSVAYEIETCSPGVEVTPKQEVISLWWRDHAALIPQHLPSSQAEDELVNEDSPADEPTTADYLQCVYETKEIEFKLVSGVSVPKFRLAALQQFFGPTFFERKYCYPLVLVQPLVATVWKDLGFERLICTLLRDGDEKMILGALSLLECGTRIFRFDTLRSPRFAVKETTPNAQHSLTFSCPERNFAMQLCSQSVVIEVKRVLERTIRSLKVLGESGTSSASRSHHPLIAILCAGMTWLVNCLHGGDRATQFWGVAGINQLIVAHCNANSLPFVKIKDSNMMNQVFRQGQRIAQQDLATASKGQVFSSTVADSSNHRLTSLNCSPFRLMIEEIVVIGSSRAVGLMKTLLLSRTFREVAAITDDSTVPSDSAFQRDLISSSDYGKVSHAIDLARDISQLNGTTNEQLQLIQYTKALFLHHTATSAKLRFSVFAPVCSEIWSWMGAAWRTVVVHWSKSKQISSDNKVVKLSKAQGDIVIAGFSLLHSIMTHPSVQIEDIVELTTFDAGEDGEMANVLHEIFAWIMNLPSCSAIRRGSTLDVLKTNGVDLLVSFVRARNFDEVALETVSKCVDTRLLLQLLGTDSTSDASDSDTNISIGEKQQIWSVLLYFDSRTITSNILETEFLDIAVLSHLSRPNVETRSSEDEVDNCNRRLEVVMLLEVLVFAASRRKKSVNTQVLFAEVCKLLLHHDIIAKEAKYLRKTGGSSKISTKHVTVSKRVMQLICCLCVDFSSQSASRVFLEHLESVGVPAWVVGFHQAKPTSEHQLSTRVELFWKDWQGRGDANTKPVGRTLALQFTNKSKSEKRIAPNPLRVQRSASQCSERVHTRQRANTQIETVGMEDELVEKSLDKPLVSVSPVKPADLTSNPNLVKLKAAGVRSKTAVGKKNANVIQTLLSIDADSALRLVKSSRAPQEAIEDDEILDSDAYSPFSASSSSSDKIQPGRAQCKSKFKRKEEKSRGDRDAKDDEDKLERHNTDDLGSDSSDSPNSSSVSSRDGPRQKLHAQKSIRQRSKRAAPPLQDALRTIFRKYDVDGDGSISFIDLRRAMDKQLTGHHLSDLEIQRWITEKDRSGQGVVGFEDFVAAFQSRV